MSIEGNILELESGIDSMDNNEPESSDINSNTDEPLKLESDSQSSEIENASSSSSSSSLSSESFFFKIFQIILKVL